MVIKSSHVVCWLARCCRCSEIIALLSTHIAALTNFLLVQCSGRYCNGCMLGVDASPKVISCLFTSFWQLCMVFSYCFSGSFKLSEMSCCSLFSCSRVMSGRLSLPWRCYSPSLLTRETSGRWYRWKLVSGLMVNLLKVTLLMISCRRPLNYFTDSISVLLLSADILTASCQYCSTVQWSHSIATYFILLFSVDGHFNFLMQIS